MRCSRFVVAVTAFATLTLGAQSSRTGPSDQMQRAATLFAASDWNGALAAYSAIAQADPKNALARFRVGVALLELGRLRESEANLRQGESLGFPASMAAYRLAQLFAEQHQPDSAIAELRRAADNQLFVGQRAVATNPHFSSLTSHPQWAALLDAFDAVVQPCKHDARFRQFDFWLGDWDVRPTGTPAVGPPSRNIVTLEDNGCVVMEHWTSPSGSEGQSFNIFDRSYGVWRQTWVDNVGGQHDYRGSLRDGNMVFEGDTPAPGGKPGRLPTRLTFFHISADSVRQFSEVSPDSGKTWQVSYDLMYVRRP